MKTVLTTTRLLLREFVEDDVEVFRVLGSHPEITRFTGDGGFRSLEEARESLRSRPLADYQKYGYGRLACVHKSVGRVIGFAGLKYLDELKEVDIGYRLLPEFWGRGLATEAAQAVLAHGFQTLALEKIIGLVDPANVGSVRVLEKIGLLPEGTVEYRGTPAAKYGITAEQFRSRLPLSS